jgi:hypothetical protein
MEVRMVGFGCLPAVVRVKVSQTPFTAGIRVGGPNGIAIRRIRFLIAPPPKPGRSYLARG